MSVAGSHLVWQTRVLLARTHQRLGWAGVCGIALLLLALAVLFLAWPPQAVSAQRGDRPSVSPLPAASPPPAALRAAQPAPALPQQAEVTRLITEIQQAAVANRLAWPAAEYRIVPATANKPPSLEVHCSLKGPYLPLRHMLAHLLATIPAFTLREFSLSRPASDSASVEAKLVMAVFLRDQPARLAGREQEPLR